MFIEVLQADDGVVMDAGQILRAFFVHEVDAGRVRRISVGDKGDALMRLGSADGFGHDDDGG